MKKKKTKECPKCKKKMGQKTKTCPCGHKFEFKKQIKNAKKCPECTEELRPRAKECTKCNYKYPIKGSSKVKYEEIKDWDKLKPGYTFLIDKDGCGPYYITETDGQNIEAGTKIEMGYRGWFQVLSVYKDGIRAYSPDGGCGFIYMGPETKSKIIEGLTKCPHKLMKKI